MTERISFKEKQGFMAQQTLSNLLSKHKYLFKKVDYYTDDAYYCFVAYKFKRFKSEFFQKWFSKYLEDFTTSMEPLTILNYDEYGDIVYEKMIFTKDDIKNIISDNPDNYIGENVI